MLKNEVNILLVSFVRHIELQNFLITPHVMRLEGRKTPLTHSLTHSPRPAPDTPEANKS